MINKNFLHLVNQNNFKQQKPNKKEDAVVNKTAAPPFRSSSR